MSSETLDTAIAAIKSGDKATGLRLLHDLLKNDPANETAWIWLATCVDDVGKKIYCLKKALTINPSNQVVIKALSRLESPPQPTLEEIVPKDTKGIPSSSKYPPLNGEESKITDPIAKPVRDSAPIAKPVRKTTPKAKPANKTKRTSIPTKVPSKPATKSKKIYLAILGASLIVVFCGICILVFLLDSPGSEENPKNTATLPVIISELDRELDGVSIKIANIKRLEISNNSYQQAIILNIEIISKNVPWTGYDFKISEWILIDELQHRYVADRAEPFCHLYDNETCNQEVLFILPVTVSGVNLYYVSDRGLGDQAPVNVQNIHDMRFIARMKIGNLSFETEPFIPSSTPTVPNTSTSTQTPIPTITFTPLPSLAFTQTLTATIEPTEGPTPIPSNTNTPRPTSTPRSLREPVITCPSGLDGVLGNRSTSLRCYNINTDWDSYGLVYYYDSTVVGIGITYLSGAPYYVVDGSAEFVVEAGSIYGWDIVEMGSALSDVTYMPENQWVTYESISAIYTVNNQGVFMLLLYQAP